jgi:hypothetical protein
MGLLAAVVLLMLAITGMALNHTQLLRLQNRFIDHETVLDWYGIFAPTPQQTFKTSTHYFSQLEQQFYWNQQLILQTEGLLKGAVETEAFMVIALDHAIVLLSFTGEVIETIEKNNIEQIGLDQQKQIVIQQLGKKLVSKDGLLSWHLTPVMPIKWSEPTELPDTMKRMIKRQFRTTILPLERVLLDLHSGRFFGKIGVIIVDISGVLLIILIFSGSSLGLKHWFKKLKFAYKR